MRRAASRAAWTAGSNKAIKMPMIDMTTNNSTNVNPACHVVNPAGRQVAKLAGRFNRKAVRRLAFEPRVRTQDFRMAALLCDSTPEQRRSQRPSRDASDVRAKPDCNWPLRNHLEDTSCVTVSTSICRLDSSGASLCPVAECLDRSAAVWQNRER